MKNVLFLITLSFTLVNCQEKTKVQIETKKPYDESYIVVFDYHKPGDYKDTAKVSLDAKEIAQVDSLLNAAVNDYNSHPERKFANGKDKPQDLNLKKYVRQYYPYQNQKGGKEVRINCFCDERGNKNWKKGVSLPAGGGDCYFTVTVNLTQRKFHGFFPNGPA